MVHEERFPKDTEFPYELYELFKMDAMDDTEFKAEFRFGKTEVPLTTCDYLHKHRIFLKRFACHQGGTTVPGIEALEALCRCACKMTDHPCRYSDLIPRSGRPVQELYMIYNIVLDYN